jgi:hypothetical protein
MGVTTCTVQMALSSDYSDTQHTNLEQEVQRSRKLMVTVQPAPGTLRMPLLFMSGDGQCYRLPQQEMVLTALTEFRRIP